MLYARGLGVATNMTESYKWFALAATKGDKEAVKKRDEVASRLDAHALAAAQLAVKSFVAEPQPDAAVNVPVPPGGWDTASAAPARQAARDRDRWCWENAKRRGVFALRVDGVAEHANAADKLALQIYLPIADLPVNIFLVLGMGLAVGFISGMFGIGGGFLMTPLLIFIGVSPAVAVASVSSHIAASSFSGAINYWRRNAIDVSLALMLLAAGIVGTATGVWLFTMLRAVDQLDLVIGLSYVTLLTVVGAIMIYEAVRAIMRALRGGPATIRRPGSHTWMHKLPLKLRFKRSKIYVSAIPVWGIGFIIGFLGAIMGIGGGFLLVPMLIYFLRVPTATVIGTSMVLTLVTMASATVMHAATNHLVDAVLALILMVGGVIGAQFGVRTGQQMRGERLRLLLGILVFAVGLRFAYELVVTPDDLYSIRYVGVE